VALSLARIVIDLDGRALLGAIGPNTLIRTRAVEQRLGAVLPICVKPEWRLRLKSRAVRRAMFIAQAGWKHLAPAGRHILNISPLAE